MRLDASGKDFERIYVGRENRTEEGEECQSWEEVSQDYSGFEETRGHNYCRNPAGEEEREFCYFNLTHKGLCAVKTCGNTSMSLPVF